MFLLCLMEHVVAQPSRSHLARQHATTRSFRWAGCWSVVVVVFEASRPTSNRAQAYRANDKYRLTTSNSDRPSFQSVNQSVSPGALLSFSAPFSVWRCSSSTPARPRHIHPSIHPSSITQASQPASQPLHVRDAIGALENGGLPIYQNHPHSQP